ncbi:MAG: class 1 fructose-bisphosphatase [Betaproteobacteria bacterium]
MALSNRWTLTRYLIEERRRFPHASGDLNALLLDVSLACKAIARTVAFGELHDSMVPGDVADGAPRSLCALSHDVLLHVNELNGQLAGLSSAALDRPSQVPRSSVRGKYLLVFDPLDGSGNTELNVSVGSIFSILRAPESLVSRGRDVEEADFLQPGTCQVAAGYALYGPTTMLMLSVGNGVAGFTLNPTIGDFVLTHPAVHVPEDTQEFAIDASNRRFWEAPVKRYVEECQAGRSGTRHKDFNMRWIASMVADAHRILMRGGVYLRPRDSQDTPQSGLLRLLYEANPIAFLIEQAGGRASTGRRPVLAVEPTGLHQRVGLVFGSRHEVERIERYHLDSADAERGNPLFAERGLFRQ